MRTSYGVTCVGFWEADAAVPHPPKKTAVFIPFARGAQRGEHQPTVERESNLDVLGVIEPGNHQSKGKQHMTLERSPR